jgi:hypothetical protein
VSRSLVAAAVLGLAACGAPSPPDARLSAWAQGPDLPRPALSPGVGALGLQIFVVGGFDAAGHITTEVDGFDAAAASWSRRADAPMAWSDANVVGVGDTLYLAGGLDAAGAAHGDAYALDPVTQSWHAIPALPPGDERGGAGVVGAPNRIYVLGGVSTTDVLDRCVVFDIAAQSWSALPALPAPRAHPAAMRRSDGWLIVAGGFADRDGAEPRDDVWGLPPLGTAWQTLAPMHLPGATDVRGGCAYGVVLGQLTCAGGRGPGALAVESYDPYLDEWTRRDAMPVERTGTPGAAVGGRLFVPGGGDATGALTRSLWIYAPLDTAPR